LASNDNGLARRAPLLCFKSRTAIVSSTATTALPVLVIFVVDNGVKEDR
jgi:hypothetical protein